MSDGVKRRYSSPAREAAAAETARRIREAASELFVTQGFAATTLKQVAERAGVGERTVYDAYRGKHGLLSYTIGHLAMGDEERIPLAERPPVRAARELDDPSAAVARTMVLNAELMERAADLILVAEEAGRADPDLRRRSRTGYERALQMFARLCERLHERGELRADLDVAAAADALLVLASPQTFEILRRRRTWSATRYRDWLVQAAQLQVLPAAQNAEGKTSR